MNHDLILAVAVIALDIAFNGHLLIVWGICGVYFAYIIYTGGWPGRRMGGQVRGLRLALGHQARVGKDTFADRMCAIYTGKKLSFASGIYMIAEECQRCAGVNTCKDPRLLQTIGTAMKAHYGDDIWVKRTMQEVAAAGPNDNIIVCDMRFPNEMAALKAAGFTTIRITRADRPIDRDAMHESETALAGAQFDHEIMNDDSLAAYLSDVDRLLDAITRSRA